jgi:hypothetical protein
MSTLRAITTKPPSITRAAITQELLTTRTWRTHITSMPQNMPNMLPSTTLPRTAKSKGGEALKREMISEPFLPFS